MDKTMTDTPRTAAGRAALEKITRWLPDDDADWHYGHYEKWKNATDAILAIEAEAATLDTRLREALKRHEANLLALGRTMVQPRPEDWEPLLGERIAAAVAGINVVRAILQEADAAPLDHHGVPQGTYVDQVVRIGPEE